MNADSAGWMGNKLGATPNLDAFAKTAHRFVNSHVTVPICQPGREAFMTGRVPHRNGGLGFNPIRKDVPTLVEVLRDAGYYTAAIAKIAHMAPAEKFPWHATGAQELGKQPTKFAARFRELLEAAAKEKKPFFINANICDPHRPFIGGVAKKAKVDEPLDGARGLQAGRSHGPRVPRRPPAGAGGGRPVLQQREPLRPHVRPGHGRTEGRRPRRRHRRRVHVRSRHVVPVLEGDGLPQRHVVAGADPRSRHGRTAGATGVRQQRGRDAVAARTARREAARRDGRPVVGAAAEGREAARPRLRRSRT